MKNYAEFWRRARLKRGLSQAQVAARLGLASSQFVSNVERGVARRYSLAMSVKLIKVLKVEAAEAIDLIMADEEERLRKGLKIPKK